MTDTKMPEKRYTIKTEEERQKDMTNTYWLLCPVCSGKTRIRLREDTLLENFPLYCPKCRQETLISVKYMKLSIIKEPDAQTQSR